MVMTPDTAKAAIENWLARSRERGWQPCTEVRVEMDDAFQFTEEDGGSHNYVTREWVEGLLFAEYVHGLTDELTQAGAASDELRRRFAELKHNWHAATSLESNVKHIILDLSYQQIIGLGPRVVPLILQDLADEGGDWFWALIVLTGNDEARGETTMEAARQAWLQWGRGRGLLAS